MAAHSQIDLDPDFTTLLPSSARQRLQLALLANQTVADKLKTLNTDIISFRRSWARLTPAFQSQAHHDTDQEAALTTWLIDLFNRLYKSQRVTLVRGEQEPEYIPATSHHPAQIKFAHGYFASALHELSHWCIAGQYRRTLPDYGYWYTADGRNQSQQQEFEQVEIKPQAIECLFSLACHQSFRVSQDNLFADFDTSTSTFAQDVYQQARHYIARPQLLPQDAKLLLATFLQICDP